MDGVSYAWLGDDIGSALRVNLTSTTFTPTRTTLSFLAGPMSVNVTFLSPIEVNDRVRQSIPFSYLYLEASSSDGQSHNVSVYSDISGEWNSGDRSQQINWKTNTSAESVYHSANLVQQMPFQETSEQAVWGTLYYAMKMDTGVTHKINADNVTRTQFLSNGTLDNQTDLQFRAISNRFVVFGIAQSLGNIKATSKPVVWAIGYTRDPALQYTDLSNVEQDRFLYYKANYSSDDLLINDFLDDFPNARLRADQLDAKILTDARSISNDYADILSLGTRQVFAATELTLGRGSDGSFNQSDVMMFMKNIGTDNRVNPVETMYQAWPMFMYIDPTLGDVLLEPLLRFQASPSYRNSYAAKDIGSGYPKSQASSASHNQGIEQSANMIIMAYAHARATGNGNLVNQYYGLFSGWADYLANSTLFPTGQLSADLNNFANQTNLAVKGIIAIKAMSELSSSLGRKVDSDMYSTIASTLVQTWASLALSTSNNLLLAYGTTGTSTLGYNLFADRWLATNIVSTEVFSAQTALFGNLLSAGSIKGLSTDSSNTGQAITTWNMFAAAMSTDSGIRNGIVSLIHSQLSNSTTDLSPFPTAYSALTGQVSGGSASPAQGAIFSLLALNVTAKSITATGLSSSSDPSPSSTPSTNSGDNTTRHTSAGTVAGGVIGGLALLGLIGAAAFFLARRSRRQQQEHAQIQTVETGPTLTTLFSPYQPFNAQRIDEESDASPFILSPSSQHTARRDDGVTATSPSEQWAHQETPTSSLGLVRSPSPPQTQTPLTSKEIARIRAINASNNASPTAHTRTMSYESRAFSDVPSQSGLSTLTTTSQARSVTTRLMTEVEGLRREMEEIRRRRLEAPPTYEQ